MRGLDESIGSLTVAALMQTDVLRIRPGISLRNAAALFGEPSRTHAVVVEDGRLIGLLSREEVRPPRGERGDALDLSRTVWDAHLEQPVVVESTRSAVRAARHMLKQGIECLIVADEGQVVGLLSLADFARAFAAAPDTTAVPAALRGAARGRVL